MHSIHYNSAASSALQSLQRSDRRIAESMQRLSSGLRINSAKDDAAGAAIAERFKAQAGGIEVAKRNAADGISLAQTAEGTLQGIGELLLRMRDLAVQSANGTLNSTDRNNLQTEFSALASEVGRTVTAATFNGKPLLDTDADIGIQVGAKAGANQQITVQTQDLNALAGMSAVLGGTLTLAGSGGSAALEALGSLDSAIDTVANERGRLGAVMNRFDHAVQGLGTQYEQLEASRSRITDADFAKTVSDMVREQILQQASVMILAQANQQQQWVLRLLNG